MKRNALIFILIFISASSLFALSKEEINSENIASLLLDAGFKAYVDDEGDVTVHDEYDMKYWIIHYPEENMLFIQSGWNAKDGIDMSSLPAGAYIIATGRGSVKVWKK